MADWQDTPPTDLEAAIAEFKAALPGWWYSVAECQVSCDASCAPTSESPHIHLIRNTDDPFNGGFHADLRQPSSLAEALRDVMDQALAEITSRPAPPAKEERMKEFSFDASNFKDPAEIVGAQPLQELKDAGWQIVLPYQKVIVEGEGADEEYQLIPTSWLTTLEAAISALKGEEE